MKKPLIQQQSLTIERALIYAGNGHTFQKRLLLFIGVQFMLAGALKMSLSSLFMMQPPRNRFPCPVTSSSGEQTFKLCNEDAFCAIDRIYQPSEEFGSITREFDLVCENEMMQVFLITTFFLGGSLGSLYYGERIEKRQTRYKIMVESILLMGLVCCATVAAPTLFIMGVGFFWINFFQRGFFSSSLILFFELSSENLQKIGPPLLLFAWGLGEMVVPLFSYHWQFVMLALVGGPLVASSLLVTFIKESPRFLVIKKHFKEAKQVLKEIAEINQREMPTDGWVFEDELRINQLKEKMKKIISDSDVSTQVKSYNYSVLFRYNSTRVRTICLLYLYVVFQFAQFLTSKEIHHVSRLGPFKTWCFIGIAETIGYLGSAYASLNQPRKETLKNIIVLSAAFLFMDFLWSFIFIIGPAETMGIFDRLGYSFKIMILIMSRVIISFGFSFLNVYVLEVFPTSIRHYAFGFLMFMTDFVFIFFDSYQQLCFALGINRNLGLACALFAGLSTMQKLRETYQVPLKENLDEFQEELLNNEVYA